MKLIYVTSSLPYGPGESFIIPEIVELVRRGHEVLVVPMYPRGGVVHTDGVTLVGMACTRPVIAPEIVWFAFVETLKHFRLTGRAFRRLWRINRPKVWLKNLCVFPKGLWLGAVARRWKADHIHAHWASTTATMAMVASQVSGIPWSFTAHRWDIVEANLIGEKACTASFIRTISERGARQLRTLLAGETWNKVKVVHMGVELPALSSEGMKPLRVPTIVSVGNLIPVKGHAFLVEACRRLKERGLRFHCLIWGQGALESELRQRIMAAGLEDEVSLKGAIPHERILESYRKREADLVVLPSIRTASGDEEGIPVALMEAMAAGIAAISTETGAIPELARDGAVELVPPGDPDALADAIARLLADAVARQRLGEAGRRRVEAEFALPATVQELIRLFMACGLEG